MEPKWLQIVFVIVRAVAICFAATIYQATCGNFILNFIAVQLSNYI
jgi:hypothetical protein